MPGQTPRLACFHALLTSLNGRWACASKPRPQFWSTIRLFLPPPKSRDFTLRADAFVLASRGEACGRPYMEALFCGCPVIATRSSGQMDFSTDANSELVDCKLAPVPWNT